MITDFLLGTGGIVFVILALGFMGYCFLVAPHYDGGRKFLCKMGWHSFNEGFDSTGFDGCSVHAKCKWCGYEGMIDSQGNLF